MTDIVRITENWQRSTAPLSFAKRRVQAYTRLLRMHRRRRAGANNLLFVDERQLADIGVTRDSHRDDWLMFFGH